MKKTLLCAFVVAATLFASCDTGNAPGSDTPATGKPSTDTPAAAKKATLVWWDSEKKAEYYGTLNGESGEITTIGTVGDLAWWQGQTRVADGRLLAIGQDSTSGSPFYLYAIRSGTSEVLLKRAISSATTMNYSFPAGNSSIVVWFDSAARKERYGRLDATTGDITPLGIVGDLTVVSYPFQASVVGNRLLVAGKTDSESVFSLYIVDLDANELIAKKPLVTETRTVFAFASGTIVMWWEGGRQTECYGTIDPQTGAITPQGTVGDLASWSLQCAVADGRLFAIGYPAGSSTSYLYIVDIASGSLVSKKPIGSRTVENFMFAR